MPRACSPGAVAVVAPQSIPARAAAISKPSPRPQRGRGALSISHANDSVMPPPRRPHAPVDRYGRSWPWLACPAIPETCARLETLRRPRAPPKGTIPARGRQLARREKQRLRRRPSPCTVCVCIPVALHRWLRQVPRCACPIRLPTPNLALRHTNTPLPARVAQCMRLGILPVELHHHLITVRA